jgi:hypothetical protein
VLRRSYNRLFRDQERVMAESQNGFLGRLCRLDHQAIPNDWFAGDHDSATSRASRQPPFMEIDDLLRSCHYGMDTAVASRHEVLDHSQELGASHLSRAFSDDVRMAIPTCKSEDQFANLALGHVQKEDFVSPLRVFPNDGDGVMTGQTLGVPDYEARVSQAIDGHTVPSFRIVRACTPRSVFLAIPLSQNGDATFPNNDRLDLVFLDQATPNPVPNPAGCAGVRRDRTPWSLSEHSPCCALHGRG